MVPDKFNMVDMGGIDLILMQGEEVSGLYNRLFESIAQCRYQCLYNWLFDGIIIPPSYVTMEVGLDEEVRINEGVVVTSDDVIHIYSVEPSPPDPEIIPLLAEENGVYNVPTGKDGFNPVTVDVPSYTPVIESFTAESNGTYTPSAGVDGFAPVIVDVNYNNSGDVVSGGFSFYVNPRLTSDFWSVLTESSVSYYFENGTYRTVYVSGNAIGNILKSKFKIPFDNIASLKLKYTATNHYGNSFPVVFGISENDINSTNLNTIRSACSIKSESALVDSNIELVLDVSAVTGYGFVNVAPIGYTMIIESLEINYL